MPVTHRNRLKTTISAVASAGLGAFTISTASSGYSTFVAGDDGLSFDIMVLEGTAWEVRTGCTYTHSGTSLSRGTLEDSSTGSAIMFTSAAILIVTETAAKGTALEQQLDRGYTYITNDGSTSQSLTANTNNKIDTALTTVIANPNSWWDTTNKRFQPNRAGVYMFVALIQTSNGSALNLQSNIFKNASGEAAGGIAQSAAFTAADITALVYLNGSSDYVDLRAYPFGTASVNPAAASLFFKAIFMG